MLRTRIIPCLLLQEEALVKTVRFRRPQYIGDPVNTARIFNELEVDEIVLLDIDATRKGSRPNFDLISRLASECFMPLAYGGGVRCVEDVRTLLNIGMEKVVINTCAVERPELVSDLAERFGSQSVIVSVDAKRSPWGGIRVYTHGGRRRTRLQPLRWAQEVERLGAGEILLTSIDREGTWEGLDVDLIRSVTAAVRVPVIAHGGAGQLAHLRAAVEHGGASAVGVGSMVIYQGKQRGVLVNFPDRGALEVALADSIPRPQDPGR